MTAPVMPFSAVFVPVVAESKNLVIPEGMRNSTSSPSTLLQLPAGVVQIIITWKGAEGLDIWHVTVGPERILTIPAGAAGQPRTTGVVTLSWTGTSRISILRTPTSWTQNTLDKGYVAGVQVIPMSLPAVA